MADASLPSADPAETPRIVAFVGAKGGCGTTLLTVNVGAELASPPPQIAPQGGGRGEGGSVCVVDMDFFKGDVAGALDLSPPRTMNELMIDPSRIDDALLHGTAAAHASGLSILAQPTDLSRALQVGSAEVYRLIAGLRKAFDLCLLDCGSRMDEVSAASAMRADLVVVVTSPNVPALRDAGRTIDLLKNLGVESARLRLVVNGVPRRPDVVLQDAAEHLGIAITTTVARDEAACALADRDGKPLKIVAPRSEITRDIGALWGRLLGEREAPTVPAGWTFARLLGR